MPEVSYVGLGALEAKAIRALTQAVQEGAEHFVGVAMADTPVDTGTLRASITNDGAQVAGSTVTARVHTGGEANEYAFYVHEGTSRMAGRPYLEGPLLNYEPVYTALFERAVAGVF